MVSTCLGGFLRKVGPQDAVRPLHDAARDEVGKSTWDLASERMAGFSDAIRRLINSMSEEGRRLKESIGSATVGVNLRASDSDRENSQHRVGAEKLGG